MLIPYSLPLEVRGKPGAPRRWNDPIRELYPHHAEFWPAEVPEHHLLRQRHLRRVRRRRRLMIRKFLGWCFGRGRRRRQRRAVKPPRIIGVSWTSHRQKAAGTRCARITAPPAAVGCHGGCR